MISGVIAIFRKELRSYFTSPIAYVVAAVFWALSGFFFSQILARVILYSSEVDSSPYSGGGSFDAPLIASQQFLSVVGTIFLFISPILTMGLYAEERRRGTMELLATSPITNLAVALGKWLAVVSFFTSMLVPMLAYQILVFSNTSPAMNLRPVLFSYAGLILMAGSMMALGMFISSLTDSTLIAAVGTFGLMLLLWVIDGAAGEGTGLVSETLRYLSLLSQFRTWVQGSVSTSSLVFFLSMSVLGIFLTVQSVEGLRWQRS